MFFDDDKFTNQKNFILFWYIGFGLSLGGDRGSGGDELGLGFWN